MVRLPFLRAALAASAFAIAAAAAAADVTSVPPAVYRAPELAAKAFSPLQLAAGVPARTIALPAPAASEVAALKKRNAAVGEKRAKQRPLAVGFGRAIPAGEGTVQLDSLRWVPAADGGIAARIEVLSPGAAGLRVALAMKAADPDLSLRVAGAAGGDAYGPVPANAIAGATEDFGSWWSPVVEGEKAVIELHLAAGGALDGSELTLARVSHLLVAGPTLAKLDAKAIGGAGACEIDVACQAGSAAIINLANAVGRMVFSWEDGSSYTCTGTMLNDSTTSFTPYLFTANHCFNDTTDPTISAGNAAYAASTLNVYWMFRAASCGGMSAPMMALQTGGAMLLGRSDDWDWTLLRMNQSPPSGITFAAWRAEAMAPGAPAIGVHHPKGDLAKLSVGTTGVGTVTAPYQLFTDGSSFIRMTWTQGVTEPGSSGSGLFTLNPGGGYYELRGGLFGGESSCAVPNGEDYYSRLDNALPLLKQYLTPNVPDSGTRTVAVEYWNATLKHYFITTSPVEINALDTGALKGWVRTGLRFIAYSGPTPGANPVCRFYMRPEVGDSHFYSGDPAECAATAAKFGASWIYEAPDVFYIPLPNTSTGACPAGTRPIWRFFNTATTNHRYTTEVAVRDELRGTPGWIAEGYGSDAVIMCSPN